MDRPEFVARLDEELDTAAYADLDASPNGLQVGSAAGEVERVAFAVDAAVATAEAAVAAGADALVTHHGIVWGGLDRVTDGAYERVAPLVREDVALYVSHLPLDGHQELGNAAGVADVLGLTGRAPFGELGPEYVGQRGTLPEPRAAADVAATLDGELDHAGEGVRVLDFGPDRIEDVAVVTGSGSDWLDEAVEAGADALVTGEGKGKVYHEAREAGLTVFLAGHYATETFGVRSLRDLVDGWGPETSYVDHPTGL
ncbi:Nif3-like dinuclear metal center hexameric protein [Halorarum salinum]|uniref:Nif3-like dinuclear metal center hexameric protein n=1 Tax=Halorarum salinum TaxID=2743089 RepID=A0A7D5L9Q1_9EURY|nr:Nif3-like dinuclear metal center hexameric protein [Halobaculum salinum]QLG61414.1 Nif3-like dinuclear metal center hexameric protein [Halobaculum salinum]